MNIYLLKKCLPLSVTFWNLPEIAKSLVNKDIFTFFVLESHLALAGFD